MKHLGFKIILFIPSVKYLFVFFMHELVEIPEFQMKMCICTGVAPQATPFFQLLLRGNREPFFCHVPPLYTCDGSLRMESVKNVQCIKSYNTLRHMLASECNVCTRRLFLLAAGCVHTDINLGCVA